MVLSHDGPPSDGTRPGPVDREPEAGADSDESVVDELNGRAEGTRRSVPSAATANQGGFTHRRNGAPRCRTALESWSAEAGRTADTPGRFNLDDRDELEGLIVDHIWAPVTVDVPAVGRWTERIAVLAERVRDAAKAHPEAVPLLLWHRHGSRRSLEWIEAMLRVLAGASATGTARVIAQRTIANYLVGAIQAEHLAALDGAGTTARAALPSTGGGASGVVHASHRLRAALSDERVPHLIETARTAGTLTSDTEFRLGFAVVLRGLRTCVAP